MARTPKYDESRTARVTVMVQPEEKKTWQQVVEAMKKRGHTASASDLGYKLIRIFLYPEDPASLKLAQELYQRCLQEQEQKA